MDKKNTILLTVIAIATLLVAVVGATFAYFATSQQLDANITANVNTPGDTAAFASSSSGSIDISVDANLMQQADGDDNVTIPLLTDSDSYLEVQLGAAKEGQSSVCTYDIIYTWSSSKYNYKQATVPEPTATDYDEKNDYFVRTIDPATSMPIPKEFTIIAVPTVEDPKTGDNRVTEVTGAPLESGTPIYATVERNFDEFTVDGQREITITKEEGGTETKNADYITLIRGLKIESSSTDTPTKVKWTFTARFYNSTKDQSVQMNKSFTGFITVNPDTIKC